MTVWSKAWSFFVWIMTPCGVSTGILSIGEGIVVGAVGGGCGFWGEFDKLTLCVCFFLFVFGLVFFLSSFLSPFLPFPLLPPLAPGVWDGILVALFSSTFHMANVSGPNVRFISWNIKGLGGAVKRCRVLSLSAILFLFACVSDLLSNRLFLNRR